VREWLSASEIAKLRLPGLPTTKVAIASRAEREGWPKQAATGLGGQRFVYQVPDGYSPQGDASSDQPRREGPLDRANNIVREGRAAGKLDDAELWYQIVLGVGKWETRGSPLSPEKRATFCLLLFRHFQHLGEMDQDKLVELLKNAL
jgi:hypothetical protein